MKIILFLLMTLSASFSVSKWTNRIGNQSCYPHYYCEPKNFDELREIIIKAASQGEHVRAIGNGYSISDIGCTDGYMLNLRHLRKILFFDRENQLVRVEAGILLQEFNELLAIQGLALPNQPAIGQISLGGAISTGVHGTGHTGSISSFVKEIELLTSDGVLLKLSRDSDLDAFTAASLGLGSLGVIYAVTIQCEPLFYLKKTSAVEDLDIIMKTYEQLHLANDFCQFVWNVETGKVTIDKWNRSASQGTSSESSQCYKALQWHVIDEEDKDLFSEIAVPLKSLPIVLQKVKSLCEKYLRREAAVSEITIRFSEQELAYLSPSSQGQVAYIAFCILEKDKHLEFYKEFEEALMHYGGCPHWGKLNFLNFEKARTLYGKNLEKFINVRKRLDPHGMFSNAFTKRVLEKDP